MVKTSPSSRRTSANSSAACEARMSPARSGTRTCTCGWLASDIWPASAAAASGATSRAVVWMIPSRSV